LLLPLFLPFSFHLLAPLPFSFSVPVPLSAPLQLQAQLRVPVPLPLPLPLLLQVSVPPVVSLWLIFFCFLPLINALFDYVSLQAARILLASAAAETLNGAKLLLDLFLDIVIALLCLGGLAFCTGLLLEAASHFNASATGREIYWAAHLIAATQSVFGDGFLFVGMLMTTLVPTIIHLVLGLVAITLQGAHRAAALAARIKDGMDEADIQAVAHHQATRQTRRVAGVLLALGLSAGLVAVIFRIGIDTVDATGHATPHPAMNYLVRVTMCGASIVNGRACPLFAWPRPTDEMPPQRDPGVRI